ncbi:MAG: sugar transporter [Lysobacteraceae bacterium]|nr:MAG: sugar transporter [Xanthomonadaceae bacterium]
MLDWIAMASLLYATDADTHIQTPARLAVLTVEAAKQPTTEDDIAATVTVIDRERIDRELARSIADLFRYEPGISSSYQGSRFGLQGITIRGMSGNRVRTEVDGVPVPNAFAIGSFSNASRNFADIDQLKQVEVVRGPSSALFGSDALGGVVSFVTRDPQDYLADKDQYFDVSGHYDSVDDGIGGSFTAAGANDDLSGMIRLNYRQGHEVDNGFADPVDSDSTSLLAKTIWGTPEQGGVELTLDYLQGNADTDVQSLVGVQDFSEDFGFPYLITTNAVRGDDQTQRTRLSLEQAFGDGLAGFSYMRWRAYLQDSNTEQRTFEDRETFIAGQFSPTLRDRTFQFDQRHAGLEWLASNEFGSNVVHRLLYGIEWERTDTEQIRYGSSTNPVTGDTSNMVGPDNFPVRDFPISETDQLGVFIQDEIVFGDSGFRLIPALRYDRYKLTPENDAIFADDNPGITPQPLDDDALSPKLAALWDINVNTQVYAQYAEGFRAPPYNDVNVGFTNFQFGYTAIPNPDLKSEQSQGLELGLRTSSSTVDFSASVYDNRYDNFIESFQVVGFDPVNQLLVFQSVNLTQVDIKGAEFALTWAPSVFPAGLSFRSSAAWANGEDQDTGLPVNSVEPFSAVAGFDYTDTNRDWGLSLLARGASGRDDLDNSDGDVFQAPGYVVADAAAFWRPNENLRLRGGIFNLFDTTYYNQANLTDLPANSSTVQRLQAPGINASISIDYQW